MKLTDKQIRIIENDKAYNLRFAIEYMNQVLDQMNAMQDLKLASTQAYRHLCFCMTDAVHIVWFLSGSKQD